MDVNLTILQYIYMDKVSSINFIITLIPNKERKKHVQSVCGSEKYITHFSRLMS